MTRLSFVCALALVALVSPAQDRSGLAEILNFEASQSGTMPTGWSALPAGSVFLDDKTVHGGKWSVRVERNAATANSFSGITASAPLDFAGKTIELHGFIRTESVSGFVALWVREDGENPQSGALAFDSLEKGHVSGTNGWAEYAVTVPVHAEAKNLFFGFLLAGTGTAWVDDMRLLVDGKPIWDAPKAAIAHTVLDTDREFNAGSRIALTALTPVQIENLATLGEVWGFLKYHHPRIVAGERHWDFDLFRVMPAVLAAPDRATAQAAMAKWIDSLGPVAQCHPCASLGDKEIHFSPDIEWIGSAPYLGADLSRVLPSIYGNRSTDGKQFYVSLAPGVGNPMFQHEPGYASVKLPDAGFQLLALYRFWNIIEYWFPYRDVMHEDWNRVLVEFIPRIALAKSSEDYQRELMAFIARVHDSHANLWSSLQVRPPLGQCQVPVTLRLVENQPVVAGYFDEATGSSTGLQRGDAIEALDGEPVNQLIERWKPYYNGSNAATVLRNMAQMLTRGDCGDLKLRVLRDNSRMDFTVKRDRQQPPSRTSSFHDQPGDTFRRLSDDVAYLKLSSVKVADAAKYIEGAAGTKGLVIDIRNYPSEFTVFALGALLVAKATPFVRFTQGDLLNPGAFHFGPPLLISPSKPHYEGKVVILIDEVTQSSAEYTAMAFRVAPNAFVIGSTTAGADGNVSEIALPGGQQSMISGIGVFYPDKRPTQRVGIVPDLEVKPTIAGIRAGRDEVLEAALRRILGPDVPAAQIEKLAKPMTN